MQHQLEAEHVAEESLENQISLQRTEILQLENQLQQALEEKAELISQAHDSSIEFRQEKDRATRLE